MKPIAATQFLLLALLLSLAGCTLNPKVTHTNPLASPNATKPKILSAPVARSEQIRTGCINGRRLICGKVMQVLPDGLIIDSGYTELLHPPLVQSWVIPGTVAVSRNPAMLELNEPGTPCVGLSFLTDIPKRPKVKTFDYIVLMGYPAGQFIYEPVAGVTKPVRKFTAGLDTAVRLILQKETQAGSTH